MKIGLSAESTIDLPKEILDEFGISIVHFYVEKDGVSVPDNELTTEECWEFTEKTGKLCHTSAVNVDDLQKHFAALKRDYDFIMHFTISSGISSGYANAMAARDGDPSIYVVDSHFTGGACALLAFYARELIDQGLTFQEVIEKVEDRRKNHVAASFLIDTLTYLYKGGRCSKLAAFGANLLRLHPTIIPDEEGKFTTGKKYRGPYATCMVNYVKDQLASHKNIDKSVAIFDYANENHDFIDPVEQVLKDFGFKRIILTHACPTNSYHSGPNAAGIMFVHGYEE